MPDPLLITQNAVEKIEQILAEYYAETGLNGYLQVSVVQKGCSGLSYNMEVVHEVDKKDLLVHNRVVLKASSLMYLLGSQIDYEVQDTSSGFVFKNPNEKRNCHCGAAFYV